MQPSHGMGGGGMGGNSLQEMQRLQQQLQAQYRQQQQQSGGAPPQQSMGNTAGRNMGGFGGGAQQPPYNSAAVMMQQQQQQQQGQAGGAGLASNPSLSMMQQQQPQAAMGAGMQANGSVASIYGNIGGFPGQAMLSSPNAAAATGGQSASSMDASSGSSARLLAMAGMNNQGAAGGRPNSSSTMQNMQLLLQQQQQKSQMGNPMMSGSFGSLPGPQQSSQAQVSQQQPPAQGNMLNASMGSHSQMMGRSADGNASQQMMLQQQLANLQKQMQQGQLPGATAGGMGGASSGAAMQGGISGMQQQQSQQHSRNLPGQQLMGSTGTSSTNLLQSRQQQLLQQIQQQQGSSNSNANFLQQRLGMMQQLARQQQQQSQPQPNQQQQSQNFGNAMSGFTGTQGQPGMSSHQSTASINSMGSRQQNMHQQQPGDGRGIQPAALQRASSQASQNQSVHSQGMRQQNPHQSQMLNQGMQQKNFASQGTHGDPMRTSFNTGQMGQMMSDHSSSLHSGGQSQGAQQQSHDAGNRNDASVHSHPAASRDASNMNDSSVHSHHSGGSGGGHISFNGLREMAGNLQSQKSFLDGNFEGGWQSNADIPDRRRVIFSILDVIRQLHGLGDDASNKLPHMAKTLEEHIYRSARTKEEYLDPVTLRRRLQRIAQGLDIHRTGSDVDLNDGSGSQNNGMMQNTQGSNFSGSGNINMGGQNAQWSNDMQNNNMGHQNTMQQQQMNQAQLGNMQSSQIHSNQMQAQQNPNMRSQPQMQQMQQGGWTGAQMAGGMQDSSIMGQQNLGMDGSQGHGSVAMAGDWPGDAGSVHGQDQSNPINPEYPNTPKFQDPDASQKKKVILQQQQRLLLLRHASKCKAGPACTTKFCNQMVVLWKHMKTCRDKNCKTSHCLSSRCVLNHYRICKSQGRTATCEVCGPVMAKIKLQGRDDGSFDPLAGNQDIMSASQPLQGPTIQDQQGSQMAIVAAQMMSHQRAQVAAMQGAMPNQQQMQGHAMSGVAALAGGGHSQNDNSSVASGSSAQRSQGASSTMAGNVTANMGQSDQNQLHQLKQHQLKMQAQLESLKELQRQQQQLLDQQTRLRGQSMLISDPNSPQAQQLQQQQVLLDELQKRCQQQQSRLQKEIEIQSNAMNAPPGAGQQFTAAAMNMPAMGTMPVVNMPTMPVANMGGMPIANMGMSVVSAAVNMAQQFPQAFGQTMTTQPSLDGPVDAFGEPTAEDSSQAPAAAKRRRSSTKPKPERGGKGKRVKGKALRQHIEELHAETAGMRDTKAETAEKRRNSLDTTSSIERAQKRSKSDAADPAPPALVSLPDNKSSLISFLSKESITKHLESLNKRVRLSSRTVTHKCLPVMQELIDDQFGWVFHDAVDPVALGLPDYFDVVKKPMHLELVKKKLENALYPEMDMYAADVRLVFGNAILYNGDTSEVGELAQAMLVKFEKLYAELVQGVESSQQQLENRGEACSLCAQQKRRFEPAVVYCQGECGMQRVKRGATYYTERSKANHWCESCYGLMKPDEPLVLDDGCEVSKSDLEESKNDALPEEAWVNCDVCSCWVHQICALFNGRMNKSKATFVCPNCFLANEERARAQVSKSDEIKAAADLPHCKLSEAIESGVNDALSKAYVDKAKALGVDLKDVEAAEKLSVRVVSSVERKFTVGEQMLARYGEKGCPTEYPVRSKCIALFQEIHGIDTLLFALYVFEYGDECAAPNRRRVYISYLDSVKYFEPKAYRSMVYQRVLIEYLKSVKARGYHTAHIWSCPPTPGDDYIFFCHPQHQLTPREDMLRAWYHTMLEKAKDEGIVMRTTNLYDEYFNKDISQNAGTSPSPTSLPYFEGDYIPGEIENIIRQLGSQSEAVADDADEVTRRLGQKLSKMKDSFIVVHLLSRPSVEAIESGGDVTHDPEDSDGDLVRSKQAEISSKGAADAPSPIPKPFLAEDSPENDTEMKNDSTELLSTEISAENAEDPAKPTETSAEAKPDVVEAEHNAATSAGDELADEMPKDEELPVDDKTKDEQPMDVDNPEDDDKVEDEGPMNVDKPEDDDKPKDEQPMNVAKPEGDDKSKDEQPMNVVKPEDDDKPKDAQPMNAVKPEGDDKPVYVEQPKDDAKPVDVEQPKDDAKPVDVEQPKDDAKPVDVEQPKDDAKPEDAQQPKDVEQPMDSTKPEDEQFKDEKPVDEKPVGVEQSKDGDAAPSATSADRGESSRLADESSQTPAGGEETCKSATLNVVEKPGDSDTAEPETAPEEKAEDMDISEPDDAGALEANTEATTSESEGKAQEVTSVVIPNICDQDPDPTVESEMFESHQHFLNYCQTNHCQFGELRRAKHSTMTVLFQLHNPSDEPKFLKQSNRRLRQQQQLMDDRRRQAQNELYLAGGDS